MSEAQLAAVDNRAQHVSMDSQASTGSTPDAHPRDIVPVTSASIASEGDLAPTESPSKDVDEASSLKPNTNGAGTTIAMQVVNSKDPMIMCCPRCNAVAATKVTIGETEETAGESLGLCFRKLPGMSRKVKVYHHFCSQCEFQIGSSSPGKRHALGVLIDVYGPWAFLLFWVIYSIVAFATNFERALPLFVVDMLALFVFAVKFLVRRCGGLIAKVLAMVKRIGENRIAMRILSVLLIVLVLVIMVLCCLDDLGRLTALAGLVVFIGGSWVFSWNRQAIKWRPVIWGFGLQFVFGLLILRTKAGYEAFDWLGGAFVTLLDFTYEGSSFVFGYLADGNVADSSPWLYGASVFAFSVLPTVIFFSSLVSVLYYLGVLQVVIYYLSMLMQYTLGTSSSESLNAAGNIFVGMTEAPLLIRPFLPKMTRSELHAVMTGGFATIAGGVLAIYISFGVQASHLLSASVMSAPAALAISKIIYPEDEVSPTAQNSEEKERNEDAIKDVLNQIGKGSESNVIEAAANGAIVALRLAGNIAGMLIAFLALIGFLDYMFSYWGSLIDWDITFTKLCGYIFYPIAFLMGIHPDDCQIAGELIGTKVVVNEFVAYSDLEYVYADSLSLRSNTILIYALCGFSNLGSIGVTLGGLTPLAPERTKDLTQLVVSAMIAGNLACFMTACIAALLYDESRYE